MSGKGINRLCTVTVARQSLGVTSGNLLHRSYGSLPTRGHAIALRLFMHSVLL
jgi:hypothetical protein